MHSSQLTIKALIGKLLMQEFRLCCFCVAHIEDEAHALLECGGHEDLVAMCYNFLQDVKIFKPRLKEMRDRLSIKELLLQLL
jgi:hypothetical protein